MLATRCLVVVMVVVVLVVSVISKVVPRIPSVNGLAVDRCQAPLVVNSSDECMERSTEVPAIHGHSFYP